MKRKAGLGSHVIHSALYGSLYSWPQIADLFSDESRLQRWLDVEAALAQAQGEMGIIPEAAAREIRARCQANQFDLEQLGEECRITGHNLVPVIRALSSLCQGGAGEYVHFGATTQDICDTGLILQLKEAWALLDRELRGVRTGLASLAEKHRATPMVGRTLGQHAMPITFGYKLAVWISEIDRHLARWQEASPRIFTGNITGAVGTFAAWGDQGVQLQARTLELLGLAAPGICWHSSRDRLFEVACLYTQVAITLGKMAEEFHRLQSTEVDEMRETFGAQKVGSSTMPHKQNPAASHQVVALSKLVRGLLPVIAEAAGQEHERDGGAWRVEWSAIPEMVVFTGALIRNSRELWSNPEIRVEKMRANLNLTEGAILSERLMLALSHQLGKQTAHEILHEASAEAARTGATFRLAILGHETLSKHFRAQDLETLLDPAGYTGMAARLVDQVLQSGGARS